jgi:hypothetical protein
MPGKPSIRSEYESLGVERFYRAHGQDYANPHAPIVHELIALCVGGWSLDLSRVLDLAAGAGEATHALLSCGAQEIAAVDPYTVDAYRKATGRDCRAISFEQIESGALVGERYSLVVCSFAMHLVERSRLPGLCTALAALTPALLVLTPHKRPVLRDAWGFRLARERLHRRVRARLYAAEAVVGR